MKGICAFGGILMPMTPEERFTKIEENLLVQATLLDRLDRSHVQQSEHIDALIRIVENHQARLQQLEDSRLSMEAAMRALFERMDGFIRGLESEGHN